MPLAIQIWSNRLILSNIFSNINKQASLNNYCLLFVLSGKKDILEKVASLAHAAQTIATHLRALCQGGH